MATALIEQVASEPETLVAKKQYERTYCSSCGGEFGPGDHGFSHCENHAGLVNLDDGEFF